MEEIKNFGVLEGKRETDFIAGTLPYEVRNESGDWINYLPPGEWQRGTIDTMACVTFSALNCIETQYKFLTGEYRNFSDRFTAKMSDTQPEGNYLWKVADSIRKDGIVDESAWATPSSFTWNSYYSEIPQEVRDQAKKFLEEWDIAYEWVDTSKASLMTHLKHAPIQVVIPGHAVMNFYTTGQIITFFDSYEPFIKEVQNVMWALKYVLTRKKPNKKLMSETTVKNLYLLAFYRLPDATEMSFWKGKDIDEFLKVAINDRANFLKENIQ